MISNYLKELIENNNRIIIPDFGAFMIQDSPEGKQISFNDFLKFNDGLLVNQIIKAEKTSKNQASDMIKDFIKEAESCFVKNIPFEIAGVGFLTKDSHGNIKFEAKIAATAKPRVSSTDVKPTIILDEVPVESKEKEETPSSKENVKENTEVKSPEQKPVEVKPVEAKPVEAKTTQKPPIVYSKAEQPPKTNIPPVSSPTAAPKPSVTKAPVRAKKERSNSIKIVLISLLALIVIFGSIGAFLYFDVPKHVIAYFGHNKTAVTETAVADTLAKLDTVTQNTIATDSVVIEKPAVAEEPKIVEETTRNVDTRSRKYYIVAGSFKNANNAERYNKKLTAEGYSSEIVMRSNGFHLVSYKLVSTRNEAKAEWEKMRDVNPQVWIYVK